METILKTDIIVKDICEEFVYNELEGKEEFSNSQNANIQKWSAYIKGSANR